MLKLFTFTISMGILSVSQATQETRTPTTTPASVPSLDNRESREHMTAEDVLRALQRRRPENRIIRPVGFVARDRHESKLFAEGHVLVDKVGRLIPDPERPERWVFMFSPDSDLPAMPVLPNATLEPMIRTTENALEAMVFEVSAETTVFRNKNYLLIRFAKRHVSPTGASRPNSAVPGAGHHSAATRAGESTNPNVDVASGTPVEDVLARLQAQAPTAPPLSMVAVSPATSPAEAPRGLPVVFPEGTPIIDRPGRLVSRGRWGTLIFESDRSDSPEPSVELLPNRNLDLMLQKADEITNGLVFRVSGQLTTYRNENYLLVRRATRQVPSGNFSK